MVESIKHKTNPFLCNTELVQTLKLGSLSCMLYQYKKTLKHSNVSYTPIHNITTNRIYAVGCGKPNNMSMILDNNMKSQNNLLDFSKF